jgi:hypothetical protein
MFCGPGGAVKGGAGATVVVGAAVVGGTVAGGSVVAGVVGGSVAAGVRAGAAVDVVDLALTDRGAAAAASASLGPDPLQAASAGTARTASDATIVRVRVARPARRLEIQRLTTGPQAIGRT